MPNTKTEYWQEMKEKAAENIAHVTEWGKPGDEHELKKHLAHVIDEGTPEEIAECIVEAVEHMTACHMLKSHTLPL